MVPRPAMAWLAIIAVLTFCGPSTEGPARPVDAPRPLVRIGLERTPCFGFCPEYEVTAAADGQIAFRGLRRWEGIERSWRIPADSVGALAGELARIGFFELADITPDKPGCGDVATDHPSIVLTASDGEREHRVNYYTGAGAGIPSLRCSSGSRAGSTR